MYQGHLTPILNQWLTCLSIFIDGTFGLQLYLTSFSICPILANMNFSFYYQKVDGPIDCLLFQFLRYVYRIPAKVKKKDNKNEYIRFCHNYFLPLSFTPLFYLLNTWVSSMKSIQRFPGELIIGRFIFQSKIGRWPKSCNWL